MKKLFLSSFLILIFFVKTNAIENEGSTAVQTEEYRESMALIDSALKDLDNKLTTKNIWVERYQVKDELQLLKNELSLLETNIKKVWNKRDKQSRDQLAEFLKQKEVLKSQLQLLGEFADSGYDSLYHMEEITTPPSVTNPVAIVGAISYIKEIKNNKNEYNTKLRDLQTTIANLGEKITLLNQKKDLLSLVAGQEGYRESLAKTDERIKVVTDMISDLEPVLQIFSTSLSIYSKKVSEIETDLNTKIKYQTVKLVNILTIIAVFVGFVFLLKLLLKRYIIDSERFYITNRTINVVSFFIVALIVAFNYINNLTYILTVLGFVSAGIAFALKDWFMSILGWFVIVLGGYVHVGDRIRVVKDNEDFLGDVLEISFTRILLFEDVTLPTYEKNRRAGRIIFIPNNYIFTYMIQNYTFNGLKTVWDGIDVMVTFDSNHKKAVNIAREISTKYSKGYTDLTRKQLTTLRTKYNLKNSNVEPRVFTFIEEYGMKISTWYLTNSYATLTLRSRISSEIVEAYNGEEDITIAYPTKTIRLVRADTDDATVKAALEKEEKGEEKA